jgi:hypothetical protein
MQELFENISSRNFSLKSLQSIFSKHREWFENERRSKSTKHLFAINYEYRYICRNACTYTRINWKSSIDQFTMKYFNQKYTEFYKKLGCVEEGGYILMHVFIHLHGYQYQNVSSKHLRRGLMLLSPKLKH